ncbi:ribosomal protein S18-alanine N-acetyltransferase [Isoalcanivorax indicus]|uniref:ribosomal protein S18-alanine N-acetyltransferase n=1 Tax=Isoalcanivorax indicus TaxID=2202653 RepID=UPI000DB90E8C|nr:ribosomal protein S18-alanine N-acetyltransferase [Isoalcanivorax indicus]
MPELLPGFRVRALQPDDIPALLPIEAAGQPTPWSAEVFRDCFRSGYRATAVEAEVGCGEARRPVLVAFQVIHTVLDEAHLLNVAVHPDWQRRGIAAALLQQTMTALAAEDFSVLYLEVRDSNRGARALYERLGFVLSGHRKAYYRTATGHEDALLMLRHL